MPTEQWRLSDCIERDIQITSPTIKNISTSSAIDDATVECMAACQTLDSCEYWTVDVQHQICQLKETKVSKYRSLTAISGQKFCGFEYGVCKPRSKDFFCDTRGCGVSMSIKGERFCSTKFRVQVLEGDYNNDHEYAEIYINGAYVGKCHPKVDS
jgi:hypothetical protein